MRRPGSLARCRAEEILEEFGIAEPANIRVDDIAWALGVEVMPGGLHRCSAQLTLRGDRGRIRLAARDQIDLGRLRFSVAHELGHLLLHRSDVIACTAADLANGHYSKAREREANEFAAELLLPRALVEATCSTSGVSLEPIRQLATEYQTSVTAAALRFIQLSPEPCALVLAQTGRVKWVKTNEHFRMPTPARGTSLRPGSIARALFDAGGAPEGPTVVPTAAWFPVHASRSNFTIVEDVAVVPTWAQTLSLLWLRDPEASQAKRIA